MQKKLIAAAVAGALFAPAALADVTIGGKLEYSWDRFSGNKSTVTAGNDGSDDVTAADHSSRINFSGKEKLGGGMEAGFFVEAQLSAAGAAAGTFARNNYVFLGGNWGQLRMGRHDTPYKISTGSLDYFSETRGDYNNIISTTAANANDYDLRAAQTVAYITPNFSGFHAAIARVKAQNPGTGANTGNDDSAWSMLAMYEGSKAPTKNGFFATLAYEQHKNTAAATVTTGANDRAWKLGLGYDFGPGKVGFVYEDVNQKNAAAAGTSAADRTSWMINGAYTFGNNTVKLAYARARDSADKSTATSDGSKMWSIGLDHAMSKRTTVYGMYSSMRNDGNATRKQVAAITEAGVTGVSAGADPKVWSFGIKHSF